MFVLTTFWLLDCFTEHFPDFLSDLPVIVSSRVGGAVCLAGG
jgi:hypothetical protein